MDALNSKIKITSKTIRGMFIEPSNWSNMVTLTWKEWIDEICLRPNDYRFTKEHYPIFKNKEAVFPCGETTKYYLTIAEKRKQPIPQDVYNYWQNLKK